MNINIEAFDGISVAHLSGDLDGRAAPLFEERLLPLARPESRLVLDMRGLDFLSSAGLRLLLILKRQTAALGGQVALSGMPEMIADTMSNTGFLEFFDAYDDLPAAIQALDGHRPPGSVAGSE
jgi:anti-sigma B factor antagonist